MKSAVLGAAVFLFALSGCGQANDTITISAASSLTEVMTEISAQFEAAHPGTSVKFNFGGSPQLVEQLANGAPTDVLATASPATMQKAVDADLVQTPFDFATNSMAIALPPDNPANVTGLADLAKPGVKTAVCAPEVPCGAAARALFEKNAVAVHPNTLELDVKSVAAKVTSGEVDAGIVYVTDVKAAGSKMSSVSIPSEMNVTTTYPVAVVKDGAHIELAQQFVEFVLASQATFATYGFAPPQ